MNGDVFRQIESPQHHEFVIQLTNESEKSSSFGGWTVGIITFNDSEKYKQSLFEQEEGIKASTYEMFYQTLVDLAKQTTKEKKYEYFGRTKLERFANTSTENAGLVMGSDYSKFLMTFLIRSREEIAPHSRRWNH